MVNSVKVRGRAIGPGHPCFIIAEAGVNHDGDLNVARQLVDAAVDAGADAVKFQTFKPEKLATAAAPKARYQLSATDPAESQLDMLRRLELTPDHHHALVAYCEERKILFLSTPFEESSADLLETLNVSVYKIPSGEITNLPLLIHVARKQRPILLSTGMSTLDEVGAAVGTITAAGNHELVLLHCVSNYPADPADANLRAMQTMEDAFGVPVGYSDHTMGIDVALAAAALGACVIEKHLTLDRRRPGPDHMSSAEPGELAALVRGVRTIASALGHGRKEPAASEAEVARIARKSVVAARVIEAGSALTLDDLVMRRPGTGLPARALPELIGRVASRRIAEGTVLTQEMLR